MVEHSIGRIQLYPYSVEYEEQDGELVETDERTEMTSDPGFHIEKRRFMCKCGDEFESEDAALDHLEEEE